MPRRPKVIRCDFCRTELADPMLGFLEHIEANPTCRDAWNEWRANVRRESGGT